MTKSQETSLRWCIQSIQEIDPLTDRATIDFVQELLSFKLTGPWIPDTFTCGTCTWVKEAITTILSTNEQRVVLALKWQGYSLDMIERVHLVEQSNVAKCYKEAIKKLYNCYYRGSTVDKLADIPRQHVGNLFSKRVADVFTQIGIETNIDLINYFGLSCNPQDVDTKLKSIYSLRRGAPEVVSWYCAVAGPIDIHKRSKANIAQINSNFMECLKLVVSEYI